METISRNSYSQSRFWLGSYCLCFFSPRNQLCDPARFLSFLRRHSASECVVDPNIHSPARPLRGRVCMVLVSSRGLCSRHQADYRRCCTAGDVFESGILSIVRSARAISEIFLYQSFDGCAGGG